MKKVALLFFVLIFAVNLIGQQFPSGSYRYKDKWQEKDLKIVPSSKPNTVKFQIGAAGTHGFCEDLVGEAVLMTIDGQFLASSIPSVDGYIQTTDGTKLTHDECGGLAFIPLKNGRIEVMAKECQYYCGHRIDYSGDFKKIK